MTQLIAKKMLPLTCVRLTKIGKRGGGGGRGRWSGDKGSKDPFPFTPSHTWLHPSLALAINSYGFRVLLWRGEEVSSAPHASSASSLPPRSVASQLKTVSYHPSLLAFPYPNSFPFFFSCYCCYCGRNRMNHRIYDSWRLFLKSSSLMVAFG